MGFGLVTRFIDHLHTPLATTSNYNVITNPHTLKITRAHAKASQFVSLVVSWKWILTMKILHLLCSRRYFPANIPQLNRLSNINYNIGTDRIENTVPIVVFLVACAAIGADPAK
jgi:hypothetical protein